MKTLYLDCFSGISGDMLLGVLLDLGLDANLFITELKKLDLDGYSIKIAAKKNYGIQTTDVAVQLDPIPEHPSSSGHHHSRNLSDCLEIIEKSSLSDQVKKNAARAFKEVAVAEAHVHGQSIHEVHFHEVGATDSIIDIVGTCIGLEMLGIERVYASALHDGTGFITCAHGRLPVPVPAVAQMLAASKATIPYIQEAISTELITPTGLALIKTIASGFGRMPELAIQKIGYGSGKRDIGQLNALRGIVGESSGPMTTDSETVMLEANIDDQSSECLAYSMTRLFENGALDVFFTPIYMKKNRPAFKLSVLAKKEDEQKLARLIFDETTTLGIRTYPCARYTMKRDFLTVETPFGSISIKHAFGNGIDKYTPEFEDCARLARKHKLPLRKIYDAAQQATFETVKD